MFAKTIAAGAVISSTLLAGPSAWADPDPDTPTGPNDPRCATMPQVAQCLGSPYAPPTAPPALPPVPTGPLDPQCMQMPASAACVGSPYLPPPPAPPMPMPMPMEPPMGGGMPGMPGHM